MACLANPLTHAIKYIQDGTKLLTCSADKTAKLLDVATGSSQATQVAAHDAPISCVKWLDMPSGQGQGVCVTAGWDKMIKVGSLVGLVCIHTHAEERMW